MVWYQSSGPRSRQLLTSHCPQRQGCESVTISIARPLAQSFPTLEIVFINVRLLSPFLNGWLQEAESQWVLPSHCRACSVCFFFNIWNVLFIVLFSKINPHLLDYCWIIEVIFICFIHSIVHLFDNYLLATSKRQNAPAIPWERLGISSRKSEIPKEHFMQRWAR